MAPRLKQLPLPLSADEAVIAVFNTWSEDMLLSFARRTANMCRWYLYHTRFSLKSSAGFPDLVLIRGGRIIFAELKRQGKWPTEGRLSKGAVPRWLVGQKEWLIAMNATPAEVYLWWPSDCHDIVTILTDGPQDGMECVTRTREYLAEDRTPVAG